MSVVNRAFISPLLVYDYVNSGCVRMESKCFLALHGGKINIAIARPILADSKKSGSALRVADHRLPAQLLNLDTDTGKLIVVFYKWGSLLTLQLRYTADQSFLHLLHH